MSKFHEKVEGRTKQIVGQMIGDHQLVREGKTQERKAEADRSGRKQYRPIIVNEHAKS